MTRKTSRGSDAEEMARILRDVERRLSAVEQHRIGDDRINTSEEENGFLIETNVKIEEYDASDDPEETEPVNTTEVHNKATRYADKYAATAFKHQGHYLPRPSDIKFGIGDKQWVGSTPITESYLDGTNTVMTAYLDSSELNGHTLKEMAVINSEDHFNYTELDPPRDKNPTNQLKVKVTFVFLHA